MCVLGGSAGGVLCVHLFTCAHVFYMFIESRFFFILKDLKTASHTRADASIDFLASLATHVLPLLCLSLTLLSFGMGFWAGQGGDCASDFPRKILK